MDKGDWWATVNGVAESETAEHAHTKTMFSSSSEGTTLRPFPITQGHSTEVG